GVRRSRRHPDEVSADNQPAQRHQGDLRRPAALEERGRDAPPPRNRRDTGRARENRNGDAGVTTEVSGGKPPEPPPAEKPKSAGKGRKAGGKNVTPRQVPSGVCAPQNQKLTRRGSGFPRVGQTVGRPDNRATGGMVLKVRHLVEVVEE